MLVYGETYMYEYIEVDKGYVMYRGILWFCVHVLVCFDFFGYVGLIGHF